MPKRSAGPARPRSGVLQNGGAVANYYGVPNLPFGTPSWKQSASIGLGVSVAVRAGYRRMLGDTIGVFGDLGYVFRAVRHSTHFDPPNVDEAASLTMYEFTPGLGVSFEPRRSNFGLASCGRGQQRLFVVLVLPGRIRLARPAQCPCAAA